MSVFTLAGPVCRGSATSRQTTATLEEMTTALFLVLFSAGIASAALPYGWKPCRVKSADFGKCLAGELSKAIKDLRHGDRKLNTQPLDPLKITKLQISQGSGPVSVNLTFTNISLTGLSDLQILEARGDWKQIRTVFFTKLEVITAHYKAEGKILAIPVTGEGPCKITWYNTTSINTHSIKEVEVKGKKYFQTQKLDIEVKPQRVVFQFDNLFNGNKELGDNLNRIINENWELIMEEVKPAMKKAMEKAFTFVADSIWGRIPKSDFVID